MIGNETGGCGGRFAPLTMTGFGTSATLRNKTAAGSRHKPSKSMYLSNVQ